MEMKRFEVHVAISLDNSGTVAGMWILTRRWDMGKTSGVARYNVLRSTFSGRETDVRDVFVCFPGPPGLFLME